MNSIELPQGHAEQRRSSVSSFIRSRKNRRDKDDKSNSSGAPSEMGEEQLDLSKAMLGEGSNPIERMRDRLKVTDERRGSGDSFSRRLSAKIPGRRRKETEQEGNNANANGDGQESERMTGLAAPSINEYGMGKSDDSLVRADSVSSSQLTDDADSDARSEQQ